MPVDGGTQATQAWLRSTWHIQVPQAWLDACVEWVTEEAGGMALPQAQLNQQVLDQWLLTDLRDLAHPVLPAGISEAEKMELNGCYCLQVDSLLDVSQPAYSQLQRVRGSRCSNDEVTAVTQATQKPWEAKPTRMLMLQLTDGVQNLEGIEYRPVPALSANLPPGTKLQVVGMVMVRLGVVLLKPENVKVLGGEVEELMEVHSQSRVLYRTLGLPEENHQQEAEDQEVRQGARIEGTLDSGYESIQSSLNLQMISRNEPSHLENSRLSTLEAAPISRQSGTDVTNIPDEDFDNIPDDFMDYPEDIGSNWQEDSNHGLDDWGNNPDDFSNGPEDFDDIPMEELDDLLSPTDSEILPSSRPVENGGTQQQDVSSSDYVQTDGQFNQPQASNHLRLPSKAHLTEANPVEVIEVDADDYFSPSPEPKIARYESRLQVPANNYSKKADTTILNQSRPSNRLSLSSSIPLSEANPIEVIEIDSDDNSSSSPGKKMARYEPKSQVPANNCSKKADTSILNYLCILKAGVWPPHSTQVVRLHAFIVTLLGSLRSSGGEWKVRATISDGTGYLDVDLSDSLLANLIGFSAAESKVLRKDPAKRGVVDAGLQNCQRELVDMCCVMSVQVDPNGTGMVLGADPLTDRECCEIQKRVTDRRS
ncbi:recQ-mediated genome instability protein 1 [Ictalurus punctatus]|uniref:RecQ-mediated genome instability protein 1 n=1 Tax=Ictalurus punctatus TaxID=7998 RepID=A0A2D0QW73_ICTPU|nr:recQ-mediated genome instability protein 1 [Ictalurus punctatus]XP_053536097.1 recQ-mediated genome instability protein 1 [Ictalurus punctatus]